MQRRSNAAVFMKWATKQRGAVAVWTTLLLIAVSLVLGFAAWLLFLWAVKSDQYDDVERPKHRMLDDDPDDRER
jgi:cbb3-type cytochrome oxidase maturation protein